MTIRLRAASASIALICLIGPVGSATANIAVPAEAEAGAATVPATSLSASLIRPESGFARFLPASLRSRITFASGNSPRAAAPGNGATVGAGEKPGSAANTRPSRTGASAQRASKPVIATTTTGPGQSGYVHYFVIETPDGERETQIGIELPDGRIAWSFPELGVVVSPFIASGQLPVNGRSYTVRHQFGLRPFPDDESMLALQNALVGRVISWVEDETPYCNLTARSNQLCLSCLGFVMRVLYPSRSGAMASLPPDFESSSPGLYITTEDLLLYLTGLHGARTKEARLSRIDGLALPSTLREELIQLASSMDPGDSAVPTKAPRKKRTGVRSYTKPAQPPLPTNRKL